MIDNENIHRTSTGLQFQAELLLERGKDGRAVGIGGTRRFGPRRQSDSFRAAFIRRGRPFQRKVVAAFNARSINYRATQIQRKLSR